MSEIESLPLVNTRSYNRRKHMLLTVTTTFILVGLAWGGYWYGVLRHFESTDDAYVAGNQVQLTSQVSGSVTAIAADDTDFVKAGQTLVRLEPSDAQLNFDKSCAILAETVRQTRKLINETLRVSANLAHYRVELERLRGNLSRRQALYSSGGLSKEEFLHAEEDVASAQAQVNVAEEELKAAKILVLAYPLEKQPAVAKAAIVVQEAWLALKRTQVVSPVNGYVAKRAVQLGSRINPGEPLMAIVPLAEVWVDANFKETQLKNMRIGQEAELEADFYGSNIKYHGRVVGLAAGTGSTFSLLPPENATGNWIKVVQRLPVKIAINPEDLAAYPLRVGLSMTVTVDTTDQSGAMLALVPKETPAFATAVLDANLGEVMTLINKIIAENNF